MAGLKAPGCAHPPQRELWPWIRSLLINTWFSLPSFSSFILRISSALTSLIFDHMGLARYEAMDAQRFDPMRRMKTLPDLTIPSSEKDMGQALRRLSQQDVPPTSVVGGIWSDHELVLVPLEVSESPRDSLGSGLAESVSSTSSSESTPSVLSSTSSSSYFTTSSPNGEIDAPSTSSPLGSPSPSSSAGTRQADTSDREDLIITRTIIRPATHSPPPVRNMFSRPSTPAVSRPTSPPSRPSSPVFQALNCFCPMAFDREPDGVQQTGQVLQVIVTQTREQYEQDLAFKEVVQEIYPEASRRRQTIH